MYRSIGQHIDNDCVNTVFERANK